MQHSAWRLPLAVLALALALAGCATTPTPTERPDPNLAQFVSSAAQAFRLGSYERAARFYQLALQRARAMDDAAEVGKQAYNLAACLLLAERPSEALPLLDEAEAAFARIRRDRGPVLLLRARALRAIGKPDEARAEIQRLVESRTPTAIQCQGWLLYGQLACDAADASEAALALARARALLSDDPALRAGVAGLAGRLALLNEKPADAGLEFDKESEYLRRAGRFRDMAESLARAGAAYLKSGARDAAANRYYRAARSWQGQGDPVRALRALEQLLSAAGPDSTDVWTPALEALFREIKQTPVAGAPDGKNE